LTETTRKSFQYSVGCLLLVVTVISGCLALIVWLNNWANGEFEIATFDCGNNREIVITAARSWEVSQPIYYFVRVNGKVVVPTTYIDNNNPDKDPGTIRFAKYTTRDGNLVGVTYADDTSGYLVIHEFSTGASFPRGEHIKWNDELTVNENRDQRDRARATLEKRLNDSRDAK